MQVLVVGGTRFVGRHLVEEARARGHAVTLFNRGQSAAAPAGVEQRTGDRRVDLSALATGEWDAVIDTCGYLPAEVASMADSLRGRVGSYVFISSVSAYASSAWPNHEGSPLAVIDNSAGEDAAGVDMTVVDGRTYGPLKVLCEAELRQRFGNSALVLRPGLVVGPHDPTQRFTYWPARVARAAAGEAVLAPGTPDAPIQFIDARDLAQFTLKCVEAGTRGTFNVATEASTLTMGGLLDACAIATQTAPRWVWLDVARLQAHGLQPWTDLPLALPATDEYRGFMQVETRLTRAAGLATRPLAHTVADTLAWYRALPVAEQVFDKAGLTAQQETAALRALG